MDVDRLLNLASYPIEARGSPSYDALVERCRSGLQARGAYVLENFLCPNAVSSILGELGGVLEYAFYLPKTHNAYLAPDDKRFSESHPRNRKQLTTSATLAYDFIGENSLLDRVYRWPPLRAFIAATLEYEELHPYADALAAVNALVYRPGTQTGWHFDNAHFSVTLMLQQAQRGGVYEYIPFVRTPDDDNYTAIEAVLDGNADGVHTLTQRAGDLVVFQGRYTLHRVTEVYGDTPRLVAVLSYDVKPGTALSAHTRRTFYGRTHAHEPISQGSS